MRDMSIGSGLRRPVGRTGFLFAAGCLLAVLVTGYSSLFGQIELRNLPDRYRIWIEEEVPYIITPDERSVFLELTTDRQRDTFIEAFWKHRDPSPGTDENEFRVEHTRRLGYVDRHFRGMGRPGWRTDRGKVYIILGPPLTVRPFSGIARVYESEVWSYQGLEVPGIPDAIELLFYKKNGMGDYVLYDPAGDGPWSLMSNNEDLTGDYFESFEALSIVEPELAKASISLIPNETVVNMPSLASVALLQNLDTAAYRGVEDTYARKFREYKDIIDVEYTSNYIESSSVLRVIREAGGVAFIHFLIEPAGLSVGEFENVISTDLIFNAILTDSEGRVVHQFERTSSLRFSPEQFDKLRQRPFCFTDVLPVLPGDYKLAVLMKNSVSKEFASLEGAVHIPEPAIRARLTPVLLAFNAIRQSSPAAYPKPFLVRDIQLYCQPGDTFLAKDTLYAHTQILDALPALRSGGSVRFSIESDRGPLDTRALPVPGPGEDLNVISPFPLDKASPGYYRLVAVLLDGNGRELDRQAQDFQITPAGYLPRPWVQNLSSADRGDAALVDNILGRQWAARGEHTAAAAMLEKAHRAHPESRPYALDLARAYLASNKMKEALAVLEPFMEGAAKDFDLGLIVADTRRVLGQHAEALALYQALLESFGLSSRILNGIGETRLALGDASAAIAAWKKSLEVDPSQTFLKERIEAAEKRR